MTFDQCHARFYRACHNLRQFGADDGEPSAVFRRLISQAAKGRAVQVPVTAREWSLYSDMEGVDVAAATLAEEAAPCIELAKQAAQVVMYLKGD